MGLNSPLTTAVPENSGARLWMTALVYCRLCSTFAVLSVGYTSKKNVMFNSLSVIFDKDVTYLWALRSNFLLHPTQHSSVRLKQRTQLSSSSTWFRSKRPAKIYANSTKRHLDIQHNIRLTSIDLLTISFKQRDELMFHSRIKRITMILKKLQERQSDFTRK